MILKTYANTQYGYTFQYPASWVLVDTTAPDKITVSSHGCTLSVSVLPLRVLGTIGNGSGIQIPTTCAVSSTVNSYAAKVINCNEKNVASTWDGYYIQREGYTLKIFPSDQNSFNTTGTSPMVGSVGCGPTFDQIISTLAFNSGLKTYRDVIYGFAFEYPTNFTLQKISTSSIIFYPQPQPIEFGPYLRVSVMGATSSDLTSIAKDTLGDSLLSYDYQIINDRNWLHLSASEYGADFSSKVENEYYWTRVGGSNILTMQYGKYDDHGGEYMAIINSLVTSVP